MLIKVCGITNKSIANKTIEYGVDALGFVFAKSKREISFIDAENIINSLEKEILKVGVFVDAPINMVNEYVEKLKLNIVQLHGDETPNYCKDVKANVIKAISIKEENDVNKVYDYKNLYGYLFDRKGEIYKGGEGKTFNWSFLNSLNENIRKKLILAGGLNINNIENAINSVNPFMVDVSSGVEKNGIKDEILIKEFIEKIRGIK